MLPNSFFKNWCPWTSFQGSCHQMSRQLRILRRMWTRDQRSISRTMWSWRRFSRSPISQWQYQRKGNTGLWRTGTEMFKRPDAHWRGCQCLGLRQSNLTIHALMMRMRMRGTMKNDPSSAYLFQLIGGGWKRPFPGLFNSFSLLF